MLYRWTKQQAYASQVQARRPVKTREIKPTRQLIELVCFLRVTLLELTDVALLQSSRRSQQLFREAADKAQTNRVRGTIGLIQQAAKARSALLTNIVLACNTSRMHEVVERRKRDGTRIEDDWLRRIGPAHFSHINFRGTMRFGVEKYAEALVQRGPRQLARRIDEPGRS